MSDGPQPAVTNIHDLTDEAFSRLLAGDFNELLREQGLMAPDPRLMEFIETLPRLTETDLAKLSQQDESCPICMTTFAAVLATEEVALAMNSPATAVDELGVTRLVDTCGHVFCRKESVFVYTPSAITETDNHSSLVTWLRGSHGSCPICRRLILQSSDANEDSETEGQDARDAYQFILDLGINPNRRPLLSVPHHPAAQENREEYNGMYS